MKKKIIISLLVVVVLILSSYLSITIYKNYDRKIDIELANKDWEIVDNSLKNIKNNMDSITSPNENFEWWELKDFNIDDETYKNSLNSLVANVRMCYLYHNHDSIYTTGVEFRKFRNKKEITSKELENLNFYLSNYSCLDNLDKYQTILISNNKENANKFISKTNDVVSLYNSNIFKNKNASYSELLTRLIIEIKIAEDLSEFIKTEYERLK